MTNDPVLTPGDELVLTGEISTRDEKRYRVLPFVVGRGVERLEVAYSWEPHHDTVIDLGIWDAHGYRGADGFRGWSGSRHGVIHEGHAPIWIERHDAQRCYRPGPIEPGVWFAELGFGAVADEGGRYRVEVRGSSEPTAGEGAAPDPVDAGHIARAGSGWFHADLHQHGRHSHPRAPDWDRFVEHSRAADLDVLPVVEYVVGRHWDELGAVQRDHPDLLVYPGREIITYHGHVIVMGETPDMLEYRHGFEDVTLGTIQRESRSDDVLFQVAHPTIYPEDIWGSYCRGCFFSLGSDIDWDLVDALEVVTSSSWIDPPGITNPFVDTAIDLWHEKLRAGHRITAVAGSDDKLGPGFGSSVTTIGASELSRPALRDALRGGRAYVRARGARDSPELELRAFAPGVEHASFGSSLASDRAELALTVRGAKGQRLRVLADGEEVDVILLSSDDTTHRLEAEARETSGSLGSFWGFELHDDRALTALANPVFLTGATATSDRA